MPSKVDVTGRRVGKLVCLDNDLPYVTCKCDCGTVKKVNRTSILTSAVNSCGCLLKSKRLPTSKILGFGVDDSEYQTQSVGNECPYFKLWKALINRTCVAATKAKRKSYADTTICDEWLIFSNFKAWMETQDWEGKDLDKDLLSETKVYSPETCMFIPRDVNTYLTTLSNFDRGITLHPDVIKKKWRVRVVDKKLNKVTHKSFYDKESAIIFKIEVVKSNLQYFKNEYGDYLYKLLTDKLNRITEGYY